MNEIVMDRLRKLEKQCQLAMGSTFMTRKHRKLEIIKNITKSNPNLNIVFINRKDLKRAYKTNLGEISPFITEEGLYNESIY